MLKFLRGLAKTFLEKLKSFSRLLSFSRLKVSFATLGRRERIVFFLFLALLAAGAGSQGIYFYLKNTEPRADFGGFYVEGVVGTPRLINPVLADSSEADRTLEALIFAGLFKSDYRGGVMADLAESTEISKDRRSYTVTLKEDLRWHDDKPLTVDDIVFTIELIKNPELRSPLAPNWQGVVVEKISERTVRFTIPNAYNNFLSNLTFGILPKHLWGNVPSSNFYLAELNLKPIGSGPYRFKNIQKDKTGAPTQYTLVANRRYPGPGPFLDTVAVRFFQNYEEAILALKKKEIHGLAGIPATDAKSLTSSSSFRFLRPLIPRYVAVFFNMNTDLFREAKLREALNLATDKEKIVVEVLEGQAKKISSPVVPGLLGANETTEIYNPDEARKILAALGWQDSDGDGILDKGPAGRGQKPTPLETELYLRDTPDLVRVAESLKKDWERIGVKVNIKSVSLGEFTSLVQSRAYQAVLFGEIIPGGKNPDLFPFWHSTQRTPPGLNLSLYSNPQADELLEKIRRQENSEEEARLLQEFQSVLLKDYPAIFLYLPEYLYALTPQLHLPEMTLLSSPQERMARINEWFLNTKRIWR